MYRRATCVPSRSAPVRSNSSNSSRTNGSRWRVTPDYWKPGRPYLDGIEYTIIPNRSTAILAFVAGKLDMTWPYIITVPLLKDIQTQAPQTICELKTTNASTNLLVNRDAAPFNNADLRRAMALTLDRKAFIDILSDGKAKIGGAMLPPPEGLWGMPPELLETLPGYGPDVQKNRAEAHVRSWKSSAMGRTSDCRSKYRPATSTATATPRSSRSTSSKRSISTASSIRLRPPIGTQR